MNIKITLLVVCFWFLFDVSNMGWNGQIFILKYNFVLFSYDFRSCTFQTTEVVFSTNFHLVLKLSNLMYVNFCYTFLLIPYIYETLIWGLVAFQIQFMRIDVQKKTKINYLYDVNFQQCLIWAENLMLVWLCTVVKSWSCLELTMFYQDGWGLSKVCPHDCAVTRS